MIQHLEVRKPKEITLPKKLFDKLLGSQSSKLFENPEKLYNYIKENRNSFNFTAGTEGVGGIYTAQEKIDELKQEPKENL